MYPIFGNASNLNPLAIDLPVQIDSEFIGRHTNFAELVAVLKKAFRDNTTIVPQRHHHEFPNPGVERDTTLLLMPAWNPGADSGVKMVTVNPGNANLDLPAIQGGYLYMDAATGQIKAMMEAKELTAKRTAAASALASKFLSRQDSKTLLMLGTGVLSTNLIKAHASVRPLKKVFVWGRNFTKAETVAKKFSNASFEVVPVEEKDAIMGEVDIISCATLSETPLVWGDALRSGQHVDLVGAYRPKMRESDDVAIQKATVYVDTQSGILESGDLAIPLKKGMLKESDIIADLFELCQNKKQGRTVPDEITLFKSVGHALEDLAAARYYYQKYTHEHL